MRGETVVEAEDASNVHNDPQTLLLEGHRWPLEPGRDGSIRFSSPGPVFIAYGFCMSGR